LHFVFVWVEEAKELR